MKKPSVLDVKNQITKTEFDGYAKAEAFDEGPFMSAFGDNHGEPWNPNREGWGVLKGGKFVWAWVRGPKAKEATG